MYRNLSIFIIITLVISVSSTCIAAPSDAPEDYPLVFPSENPTYGATYTLDPTNVGDDSGYVSIDSTPQGADVYFDGSYQGTTPVSITVKITANPSHTIRVIKGGYQEWRGHVTGNPGPGETIYQTASLVEIQPTITVEPTAIGGDYGWISIDSAPQGGEVYFDGSYQGTSPVSVRVRTTVNPSHTIRVIKGGYQEWTSHITGNPGPGETVYQTAYLVENQPTYTVQPTSVGGDNGWFKIDSAPQGADVYFDGTYYGTSPVLVKVLVTSTPSHDLKVSMSGYQDYTRHLPVNPGRSETVPLYAPLVPNAQVGSIAVSSDPSGALATLDAGQQFLTPCTFTPVVSGMHTITVRKSGYTTYTTQVQVKDNTQQKINAPLAIIQSTGTLYVDSVPQEADVKVDNTWQGQTPQRIGNLAGGYHTVSIQLSGYQSVTQQVLIATGQETRINPSLIQNPSEVKTGSISVRSNPFGASVYLNNDFQGVTPESGYLDLTDLNPGVYSILLKEPQHEDYSGSITVTARQVTPVNVELHAPAIPSALNGTLSVSSSPAGAEIFLNNLFVGLTPAILSTVIPGEYDLLLKMEGYSDYRNRVQIASGLTTTASFELIPMVPTPAETPVQSPTPIPAETRSPFPFILVPAGLGVALLFIRRGQ